MDALAPARYYRPLDPGLLLIHVERGDYWENRSLTGQVMASSSDRFPADNLAEYVEISEAKANQLFADATRAARENLHLVADGRLRIGDTARGRQSAGVLLVTNRSVYAMKETTPRPGRFDMILTLSSLFNDGWLLLPAPNKAAIAAARRASSGTS